MLCLNETQQKRLRNYNKNENKIDWFVEVAKLKPGENFGELALMNNAPRDATIKAMTDCQFATIQKNDYQKVLKSNEFVLKNEKKDFL